MPPLGPLNSKSFASSISPWVITLDALKPFAMPAPRRDPAVALPEYLCDARVRGTWGVELVAELVVPYGRGVGGSLGEDGGEGEGTGEGKGKGGEIVKTICKSQLGDLYWTFRHLVAQSTSNGCCLKTGDLLATGTVSGEGEVARGCLLEMTRDGWVSFALSAGGEDETAGDGSADEAVEDGTGTVGVEGLNGVNGVHGIGKGKKIRTYLEDGDAVRITGWAGEGVGFVECIGVVLPAN
jgi:fumarylacetoacetase